MLYVPSSFLHSEANIQSEFHINPSLGRLLINVRYGLENAVLSHLKKRHWHCKLRDQTV